MKVSRTFSLTLCESSERDNVGLIDIYTNTINKEELQTFPHNICILGSVKITATFFYHVYQLRCHSVPPARYILEEGRKKTDCASNFHTRYPFLLTGTQSIPVRVCVRAPMHLWSGCARAPVALKTIPNTLCPDALVMQEREIPGNQRCREASGSCINMCESGKRPVM